MPSSESGAPLFLGVDGGGTKTRFVLLSASGAVRATHETATTYHLQVGLDGLHAQLRAGVDAVLDKAGVGSDLLAHAFFGLPAYGEDSRTTPVLDAAPGAALGHQRYTCGNDMICGWAGSLAVADGVNITAGTGSIAYGERQGRSARAGGWGEAFGDEGSAYWIAMRGLTLFSRMSDGRAPRGALHGLFVEAFGLTSDLDLSGLILSDYANARDRLAALSRLVAEAAGAGDAQAQAIFEQAAQELAQITDAVRAQLGFAPDEPVPVSFSGGVFRSGDLIRSSFEAALRRTGQPYVIVEPRFDPGVGAALYAAKRAGAPLDPAALNRLPRAVKAQG